MKVIALLLGTAVAINLKKDHQPPLVKFPITYPNDPDATKAIAHVEAQDLRFNNPNVRANEPRFDGTYTVGGPVVNQVTGHPAGVGGW